MLVDELFLKHRAGDRSAGAALVREFEPLVRMMARRYDRRWIDREDLRQEARLAVWRAIDPDASTPFDPERGNLTLWIRGAIRSTLFHYVAKSKRRQQPLVYLDDELWDDGATWGGVIAADTMSASDAFARQQQSDMLATCLAELPVAHADVLRRRSAGETLDQIAASVGMTRQGVAYTERKALRVIRKAMFRDMTRARTSVEQA